MAQYVVYKYMSRNLVYFLKFRNYRSRKDMDKSRQPSHSKDLCIIAKLVAALGSALQR
jgi:hypothetical protein